MIDDPVIERIRKIRNIISEECDHDPKKFVEYYMEKQKKIKTLPINRKKTTLKKNGITKCSTGRRAKPAAG